MLDLVFPSKVHLLLNMQLLCHVWSSYLSSESMSSFICILHNLDLRACPVPRCSINSAEWIHGWRREELFHYVTASSLGTGFINYIEPRAQRNQHCPCWVLTKCRSSEGHRHPCPCPLLMHLSQGRAGSGTGWLYSWDRSHSVNCTTTTIFSPSPLALFHKEDPLSPS